MNTDGYEWCWQRKLLLMPSHERSSSTQTNSGKNICCNTTYGNIMSEGQGFSLEVQLWTTASPLDVFLFLSSLLCFTLDLGPDQMPSAQDFTTCQWRWNIPMCQICWKVPMSGADQWWNIWVHRIVYVEQFLDYSHLFHLILSTCTGFCSPGGLHLTSEIV